MKHLLSASLFCLCVSISAVAQEKPVGSLPDAGGLGIRVIDANGTSLSPLPPAAFQAELAKADEEGGTLYAFQYKEQRIFVKAKTAEKSVTFQTESPLFESGELSFGLFAPNDKHQPTVKIDDKKGQAEFALSRTKRTIQWTGKAVFTSPKPKKLLEISLAEYGAEDRWKDVTRLIARLQVGDSVQFSATNDFFGGDPAPSVVKNLVLTYSVDGEEKVETFAENASVRIQYDPKDFYFRLTPKGNKSFEFKVLW